MNLKLEEFYSYSQTLLYCNLNTPFQFFCVTLQTLVISGTNFVQFFDAALLMMSCKWHYFEQFRLKDSNLYVNCTPISDISALYWLLKLNV